MAKSLQDKTKVAYFVATGHDNGWEVYLSMVEDRSTAEIARAFKVAEKTAYRWLDEYRQQGVVR